MSAVARAAGAVALLALGCLPEPAVRRCDERSDICSPGYHCRLSDGICERNTFDPETRCEGVRADLLTDRRHCGRCEPTSCLTCDLGQCSVARGILATNETFLVLPWSSQGLVQQWRGWGRDIAPNDRALLFGTSGRAFEPAATPLAVSRDFDARSTREAALCALYNNDCTAGIGGALCVVRGGEVRCTGERLPFEGASDAGVNARWRVVNELQGTSALTCARTQGGAMGACAYAEGRGLTCRTPWWRGGEAWEVRGRATNAGVTVGLRGVDSIGLGASFGCALATLDGGRAVVCWGSPTGPCPTADEAVPVALSGAPRHLAVGREHACAVTETGRVECWGYRFRGRLGDGRENVLGCLSASSPATVVTASGSPLLGAREVQTFSGTTCARVEENDQGVVYCWGDRLFDPNVRSCRDASPPSDAGCSTRDAVVSHAVRVELAGAGPLHVANEPWGRDVLAVGNGVACALAADARDVFCWGRGALGRGYFNGVTTNPPCVVTF